jgi:hypothetical protein
MTPTCPWAEWSPGTVHFCETRLCAVVREPANAWSSVAYLLVAVWMVRRRQPALVVLAQVLIGVGSSFFHASGTFAGELGDQTGMYVLSCLILAYAVGEARGLGSSAVAGLWAATVAGSAVLNVLIRPIGIPLFAVELAAGLSLQLWLGGRVRPARYRDLTRGLAVFLFSFGIWVLDISRVVCAPDVHWISGHAVWHVLNAVSIAYLGRFYDGAPRAT